MRFVQYLNLMEKQSEKGMRLFAGRDGRELAELEFAAIERATNGTDSHSDESAPEISIEEVQLFRAKPYMGFTGEKLHAIYEQYGHVRDIADTLVGHGLSRQETLAGLYELYRHDVSFVKSLLQRWQKLPEGLLQQMCAEHRLVPPHQSENASTTTQRQKG